MVAVAVVEPAGGLSRDDSAVGKVGSRWRIEERRYTTLITLKMQVENIRIVAYLSEISRVIVSTVDRLYEFSVSEVRYFAENTNNRRYFSSSRSIEKQKEYSKFFC